MKEKQRIYSYRKFKGIGLASAVIGLAFLNGGLGATPVHAESLTGDNVEHGNTATVEEKPDKVVLKTLKKLGGVVNTVDKTSETANKVSEAADNVSEAATNEVIRPEGRVIDSGKDGVWWKLYENGYLLFEPEPGKDTVEPSSARFKYGFHKHQAIVKAVGFTGKTYAPEDSSDLFRSFLKMSYFDGANLDVSRVKNASGMFHGTASLENIDVSGWVTSNMTNTSEMFDMVGSNLRASRRTMSLDVSHFDMSNVVDAHKMFSGASAVDRLDVGGWDTHNMTNTYGMFGGTSSLKQLQLSNWDTRNVTNMSGMFASMDDLKTLDVSSFDTSNVTDMNYMFAYSGLSAIDIAHFNTSKVTNMANMFRSTRNLKTVDVSRFDTGNVTDFSYMFEESSVSSVDAGNFKTNKAKKFDAMFADATKLEKVDLHNWDFSSLPASRFSSEIFRNNKALKEMVLPSNFDNILREASSGLPRALAGYTLRWLRPDGKFQPYTWKDLGENWVPEMAGTWVREKIPEPSLLTFEGERRPPVSVSPYSNQLPTLPRPVQPKPNHKFKGWSKTPNGSLVTRDEVKPGETVNLHPIWEAVDNTQTRTAKIPVTKTYEADNTLDYGKQTETPGVEGEKTITTTYTVTPYTGELTNPVESEVITTPMKPTVVKVGTKPTDAVEVIPSPKQYEKDDKRVKGEPDEVTQGTPGSKTTTTTYTVDPTNGTVTPKQGEPVTVQPTPTIVKVAAKDKTDVESIPSPVVYEADKNRAKGTPDERTEGTPGSSTTVTTYTVNPQDGTVTENVGEPMRKEPTNTIVKVGAKDKVEETPIEPTVVYEKDDTRDEGTPNETIPGEKGKTVTTTTYDVNPKDGTVTEKVGEPVVTPAGVTKVKVGAKTKVVRSKDDQGRDVIDTTTYEVDPNNGKVTPTTVRTYGTEKEPTVDKKPVPSPVVYEADKNRDKVTPDERVEGEPGEDTVTTTYNVDPNTGEITPTVGQPVRTKVPTNTIVKVGAKDKVEETPIEPTVVYEKDDTRDEGTPNTTIPGDKGHTVTTTTYDVNPKDGTVTEKVGEPVVTPAGVTKVKVGAKTKVVRSKDDQGRDVIDTTTYEVDPNNGDVTPTTVRTYGTEKEPTVDKKPVPSPVVYEADKNRAKGTPDERVEGVPGEDTVTTTYTVNPNTGEITSTVGEPVRTKQPTNTVVKVGAKDKVEETPIEPTVVYEKDDTRDEGTPNETIPGEKGKTVTTTTYNVNPKDGAVTEKVGEPVVTPAGVTKVKVGAKTKVEIIKDGGKTIQRTTSYDVDPNTGKATPHVNDEVISDNGVDTPPTVEIPEYTDPIGGSLDGEGNIVTPPTVEIPEYTDPIGGSLDGEVNIVTPPTVDIPEYTDPIGGSLDGEGNIVTPPTVEIPEYTGAIGGSLDGEGNIVTPPTVEIPEYTETEQPQTLKPEITPPTVDKPEYTGPIGGAGLDGEGNLITPPTVDRPAYTGDIEPTVERQVIPAGKRYEKDTSREKGQPNITIQGKDGSVTTTFHYHVDKDGNVISSKGSSVTEEPVATVIKVAAKDKVEVKVVESPKRYVGDATKELGDDSETPGTPGEVRIRTIYDVNPETGEITERTEKDLRVVPTETVITKGTKPTVKTVERDGKVYEQTTTYTVNEKTGELTSSTTEKLIKDVEKQTETQKQLPNTGDAGALASLAGLGVGLLGVRLGRKREE